MRSPFRTLALLALAALIAAPAIAQEETWEWSGRLAAGQSVEIKNANGALYAERASGDEIEVVAIKEGPAADRAEVQIEVVEHEGGVTICTVYPGGFVRRNSCEPGDEGRISSDDNDTEVTFRVRVPAGVDYVATTMNGAIEIDDLASDVEALTMNGKISISTSGWARAKTMNGAIEVEMGSADWTGDMKLSTMNGAVRVTLPDGADVDLEASTMNGSIDSDFPLDFREGWVRNRASGQIGSGGRGLDLSTMNGSIRIRRS